MFYSNYVVGNIQYRGHFMCHGISSVIKTMFVMYCLSDSKVWWRQLGLAALDIPQERHLMNSPVVLPFWHQMCCMAGSFLKFSRLNLFHTSSFFFILSWMWIAFFFLFIFYYLFLDSCDEVSACKRLLEKANLEGYQVYFC
jgi:hypothetical protein